MINHSLSLSLAKLTLLVFNLQLEQGNEPSVDNAFKEAVKELERFDKDSCVIRVFNMDFHYTQTYLLYSSLKNKRAPFD